VPVEASVPPSERRQLSVLCCNLVVPATLAQDIGIERLQDLTRRYRAACSTVVTRYDGYVASYFGTRLLVYFGYPRAHADDAERAIRAGGNLITAVERIEVTLEDGHTARLAAQIGIHTGSVVIDDVAGHGMAMGEAVTVAEALHREAAAGAVVASDATLRLVRGMVVSRSLGERPYDGGDRRADHVSPTSAQLRTS